MRRIKKRGQVEGAGVVTSIFSDEKISRLQLVVFALSYAQTKTSLRLAPIVKNHPQG